MIGCLPLIALLRAVELHKVGGDDVLADAYICEHIDYILRCFEALCGGTARDAEK